MTDAIATPKPRLIEVDVVRAVALIGVVFMNYQGYLIFAGATRGDGLIDRFVDPFEGPLSTRFAATFVVVAGMSVTLLTNRSRLGSDRQARNDDRWRLARRGLLLLAFGQAFDWIWSGTILPYYGVMFMVAAFLFTLRIRWLIAIGAAAALVASAIQWWGWNATNDDWLFRPGARSVRGLVFRLFVNGTHPLLPWLAFLCLGMVLGRLLPFDAARRRQLALAGLAATALTYVLSDLLSTTPFRAQMFSTDPYDRGVLYTVNAAGTAVLGCVVVGWLASTTADGAFTKALAAAGRMSLTLYVLHALVFNALVTRWAIVPPGDLSTAVLLALGYWVFAIAFAAWWQATIGMGPLERVYRRFGGDPPPPSTAIWNRFPQTPPR